MVLQKSERPHVLVMSEITVDGKLTLGRGISSKVLMEYMSHETEILLHRTRAECDAIMVGANTIRIDNSYLTVRHVEGKSPIRVIPTTRGNIPLESNIFNSAAPTLIALTRSATEEQIDAIRGRGADIVYAGEDSIDLSLLMKKLKEDFDVNRMMVEGGPTLIGKLLDDRLIDEFRLIHLPYIVGGEDTPSLVGGFHAGSVEEMIRLNLKNFYACGTNLVTEYDVAYR